MSLVLKYNIDARYNSKCIFHLRFNIQESDVFPVVIIEEPLEQHLELNNLQSTMTLKVSSVQGSEDLSKDFEIQ